MTYLTIARFQGEPEQLIAGYRSSTAVMDEVGRDHGLILHAGAGTRDGLLVVNLWPSHEASESAAADPRRLAVLERQGSAIEGLDREHHHVEHCLVPGASADTVNVVE